MRMVEVQIFIFLSLNQIGKNLLDRMNFSGKSLSKGDQLNEHKYSNHKESVVNRFDYMIKNNGAIPDTYKTKKFAQRVLQKME